MSKQPQTKFKNPIKPRNPHSQAVVNRHAGAITNRRPAEKYVPDTLATIGSLCEYCLREYCDGCGNHPFPEDNTPEDETEA